MTTRRGFLIGGSVTGLVALSGCLSWFRRGDDEEDEEEPEPDEEDEADEDQDEEPDPEDEDEDEEEEEEPDKEDEADEEPDKEDDDRDEPEPENETDDDEEEELPDIAPDRNETEPDRDEYDRQERREVIERPVSDIEIEARVDGADGTIRLTGAVENVSDEWIDAVDLDFEFYDAEGNVIGLRLINVHDIDAGATVEFEEEFDAHELDGTLNDAQIVHVDVFGFPNDED